MPMKVSVFLLWTLLPMTVIGQRPVARFCAEEHSHPVDVSAQFYLDSLQDAGVDTLMFYRDWIGVNGFRGYGKVIWMDGSLCKQIQLNYDNRSDSIFSILHEPGPRSVFEHYVTSRVDTVYTPPKPPEWDMSHDADHFFWFKLHDHVRCFHVKGLSAREEANRDHPLVVLVNMLREDNYFERFVPKRMRR